MQFNNRVQFITIPFFLEIIEWRTCNIGDHRPYIEYKHLADVLLGKCLLLKRKSTRTSPIAGIYPRFKYENVH